MKNKRKEYATEYIALLNKSEVTAKRQKIQSQKYKYS